jgi:hypothetical protein
MTAAALPHKQEAGGRSRALVESPRLFLSAEPATRQTPQKGSVLELTVGANPPHSQGRRRSEPWSVCPPATARALSFLVCPAPRRGKRTTALCRPTEVQFGSIRHGKVRWPMATRSPCPSSSRPLKCPQARMGSRSRADFRLLSRRASATII